jgi:prefoldin subunit 5
LDLSSAILKFQIPRFPSDPSYIIDRPSSIGVLTTSMSFQRDKVLPSAPPCFENLQRENSKLKERNVFLQDVVEVLYVQNQQLSACLDTRTVHQREHQAKIERLFKSISDLRSSQAQNQDTILKLDRERQEYWNEFCQYKSRVNSNHVWEYLEKIKSDIIDKQNDDLIRQNGLNEIVIGIKVEDLYNRN